MMNERKIEMQARKPWKNILFSFQLFNYQYGEETSIILQARNLSLQTSNFIFWISFFSNYRRLLKNGKISCQNSDSFHQNIL